MVRIIAKPKLEPARASRKPSIIPPGRGDVDLDQGSVDRSLPP
jgi:hypothetical protein